jgi:hypothetical protein
MFNEKAEPDKFTVYKRVAPKKGTAVIFDGLRYHGSNNPIESNNRYIINAGLVI